MKELPRFTGQQLMDHMRKDHGYTSWYSPKTNSKEYKLWQRQHEQDCHGRWADQQDHTHRTTYIQKSEVEQ